MLRLLLLQVLVSCLWLGHSEVVRSFVSCPQFFYRNTPPNNALQPANPAWICQRYNNQYHYATLYDRNRRIPVYSAYIYQPGSDPRPQVWLVEPQLINTAYSKDMEKELTLLERVTIEELKKSQAVLEDYNNLADLSHGHLNPSGHQKTYIGKLTTFTLTNVVPQDKKLNNGAWSRYEVGTMSKKRKSCTTTYVITGAVPGQNSIAQGRVNVPSYIWSAACCKTETNMKAWAVIAENNKDEVQLLTLGELEAKLSRLYGRGQVALFHRDCPR
ncbi:ENDD1 protein, partial [Melanocharis versteri]|nr:ENDD1 protein [Melanocharis versteri]